jgi:hypothetical protein
MTLHDRIVVFVIRSNIARMGRRSEIELQTVRRGIKKLLGESLAINKFVSVVIVIGHGHINSSIELFPSCCDLPQL